MHVPPNLPRGCVLVHMDKWPCPLILVLTYFAPLIMVVTSMVSMILTYFQKYYYTGEKFPLPE